MRCVWAPGRAPPRRIRRLAACGVIPGTPDLERRDQRKSVGQQRYASRAAQRSDMELRRGRSVPYCTLLGPARSMRDAARDAVSCVDRGVVRGAHDLVMAAREADDHAD